MRNKFKYFIIFILSFILITPNIYAANYDKVDDTSKKIYDYGEFLSDSEESELKTMIDSFIEKYDLDMVIVTKKDYDYYRMQEYAQDFYDYNNFGVGKTKNGILLFYNVDSEGPVVWITTTGEGIRMYDDARLNSMKQSMSSVKSSGNYKTIKTFVERADYYAGKGVPDSNKYTYIDENGDLQTIRRYPVLLILIISAISSGVVTLILVVKNHTVHKATDAKEYFNQSSFRLTGKSDVFVSTHTTKVHRPTSSSSGGHGGSSISHGSSGTSHGGSGGRL